MKSLIFKAINGVNDELTIESLIVLQISNKVSKVISFFSKFSNPNPNILYFLFFFFFVAILFSKPLLVFHFLISFSIFNLKNFWSSYLSSSGRMGLRDWCDIKWSPRVNTFSWDFFLIKHWKKSKVEIFPI